MQYCTMKIYNKCYLKLLNVILIFRIYFYLKEF